MKVKVGALSRKPSDMHICWFYASTLWAKIYPALALRPSQSVDLYVCWLLQHHIRLIPQEVCALKSTQRFGVK
jgi:hypothetical protein